MSRPSKGRVVRVDAKVCHVELEDGRILMAAPRGTLFDDLGEVKNPVAVGDWVLVELEGDPVGLLEVLPRRNVLGRTASSHDPREQILAANVDQVLVIGSVHEPRFSSVRTDRILAACQWHDIPGILVLNKVDLADPEELAGIAGTYEAIPVPVLRTSAVEGTGIERLREVLRDRVSVLYGASGVGKSSLLNALQPGLGLKVGRISRYWESGRHTTAYSRMLPLESGGRVIDTPGIRVFRIHRVHHSELKGLFPEFACFQAACRFPNCTHDHEPDCAVLEAVERGAIARTRYMSYLEMLAEALPDLLEAAGEAEPPEESDESEGSERAD
jgi:ribosome biogenesis GTPase